MVRTRISRLPVIVALLLALAACHATPPPPADPFAQCLATLTQRHAVYERMADWSTPEGCGVEGAVRLTKASIPLNRPLMMGCPLAVQLLDFETRVVQPTAWRYFRQPVNRLLSAGSYVCRVERGGRKGRLSQHALGKAIDVTAFELADGTRISVLADWRGTGPKSLFLHEVTRGACDSFNVVLSPNRDAYHRDHLHLDIGPYKLCGA